jgi:HK97 family phage major capsid protein
MLSTKAHTEILMAERRGIVNQIEKLASKRELTPEEQAAWDELTSKVTSIDERLREVERQMAGDPSVISDLQQDSLRASMGRRSAPRSFNFPGGPSDGDLLRSWLRMGTPGEKAEDCNVLARRGYALGAKALEFRAQTKGTASAGGYTVPVGFLAEVQKAMIAMAPIRKIARVISTDTGETLKVPTNDDTSNVGAIVSEAAEHTEQAMTFGEISLGAFTYSSKLLKVSNELLQDSGVNLEQFLGESLGERIGRAQSAHFMTGSGSGEPQGVITAASTTSAGSATAIAASDLVNLVRDVDPAYLDNSDSVAFVMHKSIWAAIRKLADSQGRFLVGDLGGGAPPQLLGYPVYLTNDMDSTIASTKKSVLFGNFKHYAIRDVNSLVVSQSSERFFEFALTAFLALQRTDAKVLQAAAFRVLAH